MATIIARYRGTCPRCGKEVLPGDRATWVPGQQASHEDCAAARSVPAVSAPGMASEKQIGYLRRLAGKLDRIDMFDSFGASGPEEAASIRSKIASPLSAKEASDLIGRAQTLIDDEM